MESMNCSRADVLTVGLMLRSYTSGSGTQTLVTRVYRRLEVST